MNETVKNFDIQSFYEAYERFDRRQRPERRSLSLRSLFCSIYKGQRRINQRSEDKTMPSYIDVYDVTLFSVVMLIISLCIADAYFTLIILSKGGSELNPFMDSLLAISPKAFFFGKYIMTSSGLFIAVMHINFPVFKFFSMRFTLHFLTCVYFALIIYEVSLLTN